MSRKVYRYGCLPPTHGANLVAAQLRAAHDYQGDLVTIERLRRAAIRLVDACPEVAAAEDALKAATKSDRKAAESALREARKAQRSTRWARAMLGLIKRWDRRVRKELYAWTPTFWGTKLDVGARHEQARKAPLYGDDAIEPSDPKRRHWNAPPDNGTRVGRLPEVEDGQVGIQIQGGMATEDAASGTMARLEILPLPPGATSKRAQQRQHGLLSIRVGSDGRAPVWATWPILYHRPIPHTASWKWVRVSVRHVGRHARWSAEITVDDAAPRPRDLDRNLTGTLFVEWAWEAVDGGGLRVARWTDDRGGAGEVVLPARIAKGIRIPDGHRAVRDIVFNELRPKLQAELQRAKTVPGWLREAGATLHLWRSPVRLHALHRRWAAEPTIAPAAYTLLDGWVRTDRHLWDYEAGVRRGTLAQRRRSTRHRARLVDVLPDRGAERSGSLARGVVRPGQRSSTDGGLFRAAALLPQRLRSRRTRRAVSSREAGEARTLPRRDVRGRGRGARVRVRMRWVLSADSGAVVRAGAR